MSDDRVSWTDFVIALNRTTACHLYAMVDKGAAFCNKKIVPAIFFINMRCLNPFTSCFYSIPDNIAGTFELESFRIKFVQINSMMSFIKTVRTDVVSYIP